MAPLNVTTQSLTGFQRFIAKVTGVVVPKLNVLRLNVLNHVALVLCTVLAMPAVPERLVKVHVIHDQQISGRLDILKENAT